MRTINSDTLKCSGFATENIHQASIPSVVWTVAMEVAVERKVSEAEVAVLRLVDAGHSREEMACLLGMPRDPRLVDLVSEKALRAQAIETFEGRLRLTEVGHRWLREGTKRVVEYCTWDVEHNPLKDRLEWFRRKGTLRDGKDVMTVELERAEEARLADRFSELGRLVRERGLPDERGLGDGGQRPPSELRHAEIISTRTAWRKVDVVEWRHPLEDTIALIGQIEGAENPILTSKLMTMKLSKARNRIIPETSSPARTQVPGQGW